MSSQRSQLMLFFAAVSLIGVTLGIQESILNNFLSDTFALSATGRGWLELPRELPGLLVVLTAGALWMLPVTRVGVVGALVFSAGLVGVAVYGGTFGPMVAMLMVGSAGMHLLQPIGASLAIGLSGESNRGKRMGQMGAIGTAGVIVGSGGIALFLGETDPRYRTAFLVAAVLAAAGGAVYACMHVPHLHQPRARLVVKRKFWLYYLLEFLFGARKQIFITFGPWVLIQVYKEPARDIAGLITIASVIGLGFKPLVGYAIDRFGERLVMIVDGIVLAVVCLGYGYALRLFGDQSHALIVACGCYILDNLLFALGTGRAVYMSRIADSPQEVTSTVATGISINHIASMFIPAVAGAVWMGMGYERVFLGAAILALCIAATASLVPGPGRGRRGRRTSRVPT